MDPKESPEGEEYVLDRGIIRLLAKKDLNTPKIEVSDRVYKQYRDQD